MFAHLKNSLHHLFSNIAYRKISGMPPCITNISIATPFVNAPSEELVFLVKGLPSSIILQHNIDCNLTTHHATISFILAMRLHYNEQNIAHPPAITKRALPNDHIITSILSFKQVRQHEKDPNTLGIAFASNCPQASARIKTITKLCC